MAAGVIGSLAVGVTMVPIIGLCTGALSAGENIASIGRMVARKYIVDVSAIEGCWADWVLKLACRLLPLHVSYIYICNGR